MLKDSCSWFTKYLQLFYALKNKKKHLISISEQKIIIFEDYEV